MQLRTICFDAAGTLFDVREPVGTTYARLGATFGVRAEPSRLTDGFRRTLRMAPPMAFPGVPGTMLPALERRWWRAIVEATFAAAGATLVPEGLFTMLFEHYAGAAAWRRYDDTLPVLRSLRRRGCRLAIVSNFDGRLAGLVDGLGIRSLVDVIVCSGRTGTAKPDARIFHHTLARLGAPPAETLHVGDDVAVDIAGARAAGLHAVLIDRRRDPRHATPPTPHATATISSLDQLEPLLERRGLLDG